jgi:hypothetical protein
MKTDDALELDTLESFAALLRSSLVYRVKSASCDVFVKLTVVVRS